MILEISPNARTRLLDVLQGSWLVVSVLPGGCNGFSYHYDIKPIPPESAVFVSETPPVCVEISAKDMLDGGILQYEADELGTSFFSITNPNATAKCGCGNSFSTF